MIDWKKEFYEEFPCLEQVGEGIKCEHEVVTDKVKDFIQKVVEEQEKRHAQEIDRLEESHWEDMMGEDL